MKSWILVTLQFLIIGLFIYRGNILKFDPASIMLIIIAFIIGITAIWSMRKHLNVFPELRKKAQLLKSGPYAFVRNPMYLSLLIFLIPALYPKFDILLNLGYFLLIIVLYLKSKIEEKDLTTRFQDYGKYKKSVKSIIPWLL